MDSQSKRNAAHVFAAALANSLSAALTEASGATWPLEVVDSPKPPTIKEPPIHFRLTVSGAIHGDCFIEFYEPQVADLATKILGKPIAALREEHVDAVMHSMDAALSSVAQALEPEYGAVSIKIDRVSGLAFGGMFVVLLAASSAPLRSPVLLYFEGQLLEGLCLGQCDADQTEDGRVAVDAHNLKLVMDVELNVSLRFGQRQIPLRDVLDLGSGSVVELDRMVDEPVELLLDGKLIARGEAVIVDGNYGLRVTEIPQPVSSHFLR